MEFMNGDQSWSLLKNRVFPNRDCPSKLERIGMDIARSCKGLPLAIVLAAEILSTVDETPSAWSKVAKKVGSGGDLEKMISLSFTHLPHHLRPCFLYMGCFPDDYEIRVSKLTKLWIAEGFVEPREEQVAEEYLEDLVKRNLALVTKRKSDGKIKSCNIHDSVHEICKRRAEEENYRRRHSIVHCHPRFVSKTYRSTLRSIICFRSSKTLPHALKESIFEVSRLLGMSSFLGAWSLLRVLDLMEIELTSFPKELFDLFHLRYLALIPPESEIPAEICRLQNLHTLIFYEKMMLIPTMARLVAPVEIWTMPLLTHLISYHPIVFDMRGGGEKLAALSMVTRFICTDNMMEMIPNIKKLGIAHFGAGDYQFQNLVLLRQLEKLKLVNKAHGFYPNSLRKLTLRNWKFPWTYMETVGSLPNLQVLKLTDHACVGDTWETKEEQFGSLEFLYIEDSNLKNWVTERSHFPRLNHLSLFGCCGLREIPDDIGEILTLQLIEVDGANKYLVQCIKWIRDEQHDNGNEGLQVRFRPKCARY